VFRIPLTLVLVTAISLFICSLLATREGVIPPNDGVIELPLEGFSSAFLGEYGEALYPVDADATSSTLATAMPGRNFKLDMSVLVLLLIQPGCA
jgi:hypothetical protein